ncbi:glucan endo-1,3-beta-glucosidase, basic isoform-like [Salvia miltiorrhiza]|uniref:glucan endo-1,3-beta-glucosidase, basic isoform-like n=1 Tax=Salvia miltiorrhiza TaxID=226208 RepID=UPI0025AD31F5|nr:glucan endo-1,3-beta-glucosidase, basic isoform-like [Salvia miltiorrhiza]
MERSSCLENQCFGAIRSRLMLIAMAILCMHNADAQTGACYGTLGNNLPPPREMIALCKHHNIQSIRLYNPNPALVEPLQGSNVSVIVGVPNEEIQGIARDESLAISWVRDNILKYRNINFRYIAVGNEISPSANPDISPHVPIAMQHISDALAAAGLRRVKVSTALSMEILGLSNPPSLGSFQSQFLDLFINPIIKFLVKTNSPFLVNVYPYFAYVSDTTNIRLDYALFTSKSSVVKDGAYQYYNLFDAMVDAVHVALEKAGGANIRVVVSETGWPSAGGTATTVGNAGTYNSNLLKSVKKGAPRRPGKPIETYIFDLIDENNKSPELEKHWGIFLANKNPKYPLSFTA